MADNTNLQAMLKLYHNDVFLLEGSASLFPVPVKGALWTLTNASTGKREVYEVLRADPHLEYSEWGERSPKPGYKAVHANWVLVVQMHKVNKP